ncbi:MAG: LicD family protein [Holdemanella sp.]|nr:LicD family protein [Holdemanella sp.]
MEQGKELTMEEIHDVGLRLLKDFHKWAVENDVKYSITYGTLIGQIRYKGFIPWDNDIDIMVSRPDFEKLVDFYLKGNKINDQTALVHYKVDPKFHLCYARVTDTNTIINHGYVNEQYDNSGVWLDILPLDGFYPDKYTKFHEAYRIWVRALTLFYQFHHKDLPLIYWGKKVVKLFYSNKNNKCVDRVNALIQKYKYDNGDNEYVADLTQPYPCVIKKACMDDIELVPFEDTELYAIKDYDEFLRSIYGDYMTPPPENERIPHNYKAYWRKK